MQARPQALKTSPEAVCEAVQSAGEDATVDTARRGSKSSESHDERPTDPEWRPPAFTTEVFKTVTKEVFKAVTEAAET